MPVRSEVDRRVIASLAACFDGQPGGARSAPEGGRPRHTTIFQ